MTKKFYEVMVTYGKSEKVVMGWRKVEEHDVESYMKTWEDKIRNLYKWNKQITFYISNPTEYTMNGRVNGSFLAFNGNDRSYNVEYIFSKRLDEERKTVTIKEAV